MKSVRLLKEHRHGGELRPPGTPMTLEDRRAAWLVEQGIAAYVTPKYREAQTPVSAPVPAAPTQRRVTACCGWGR